MTSDATFSESYIVDIVNTVVTATNTGSGTPKFIVSVNVGIEWKTWSGSA